VIRYRGWENPCKREEPAPGLESSDEARLAARYSSLGSVVARQNRKGIAVPVPVRKRELRRSARTS